MARAGALSRGGARRCQGPRPGQGVMITESRWLAALSQHSLVLPLRFFNSFPPRIASPPFHVMESCKQASSKVSEALSLPPKWLAQYSDFITKNASAVSQIESALRSLTYIIPGMRSHTCALVCSQR